MLTVPFWLQQKNSHVEYRHFPQVFGRELLNKLQWENGAEKIADLDEFAAYEIMAAIYPNGTYYVYDYAYLYELAESDYSK